MRRVFVIGKGMMKWGELWDKSLRTIFCQAALNALKDAGVDRVDSLYIGCMTSGLFVGQEHLSSLLADYIGMKGIPAVRVESACAAGGVAIRQGFLDVASGNSEVVLVGGVEKMTDVSGGDATYALSTAADMDYEGYHGVTFPGLYAMMARAHMERYGTKREQLASVAVKNHRHGLLNPDAQFHIEISVEDVLRSTMVADPLTLLDCSPITDGAAAIVLCSEDFLNKRGIKRGVEIIASSMATDTLALHQREDITRLFSTEKAAEKAYSMAGITPSDIDLAEVHDCFTIAEIMVYEAIGLCERGKGGELVEKGETSLGGRIPVNVSGGLKSKGHPVGATGVAQACEIFTQLMGEAGKRQVDGAEIGLTQNMGGSGGSSVIHIFKKRR